MNTSKFIYGCGLLLLLVLGGCADNEGTSGPRSENITFTIFTPSTAPNSRAITELSNYDYWIKDLDILLFDENLKYVQYFYYGSFTDEQQISPRDITIKLPVGKYYFVLLANAHSQFITNLPAVGTTKSDVLETIQMQMTAGNKWNSKPGSAGYKHFPMWGESSGVETLPKNSGQKVSISLIRMLAKVNVISPPDFTMKSIRVYNYNTKGYVASKKEKWENNQATELLSKTTTPLVYDDSFFTNDTENSKPIQKCIDEIFIFESAAGKSTTQANNTCLVVGGIYKGIMGYYRIDFVNDSGTYLELLRNYKYQIKIKEIKNSGYATPEDAFNNGPSDLETKMLVWNEKYAGIDDRQFMLSVSKKNVNFDSQIAVDATETIDIFTDYSNAFDNTKNGWKIEKIVDESDQNIWNNSDPSKNWLSVDIPSWTIPNDQKQITIKARATALKDRTGYIHIRAGNITYIVNVKQKAILGLLAEPGILGVDKNGRLTLDGSTPDNPVFIVYFKYGSLIGLKGGPATSSGNTFSDPWKNNNSTNTDRIAWYPYEYEANLNSIKNFRDVPYLNPTGSSPWINHNPQIGIGDPCLMAYKDGEIFSGLYMTPENPIESYFNKSNSSNQYWRESGGLFNQPGSQTDKLFYPAAGGRTEDGVLGMGVQGLYYSSSDAKLMAFTNNSMFSDGLQMSDINNISGPIRCKKTEPNWFVSKEKIILYSGQPNYPKTGDLLITCSTPPSNYDFFLEFRDASNNVVNPDWITEISWGGISYNQLTGLYEMPFTITATDQLVNSDFRRVTLRLIQKMTIFNIRTYRDIEIIQCPAARLAEENILGINVDGELTLDGSTENNPVMMVLFRWGSLIGLKSFPGNVSGVASKTNAIAWYPAELTNISQITDISSIPYLDHTNFENETPYTYHKPSEGRGDPCKMALKNGQPATNYRLPTGSSSTYEKFIDGGWLASGSQIYPNGPKQVGRRNNYYAPPSFFPATGYRLDYGDLTGDQAGFYWTGNRYNNTQVYAMSMNKTVFNVKEQSRFWFFAVRCVED